MSLNGKTTPISFRLTEEDAEFLAGIELPGAITPSEKLRVLVTRARMEHASSRSYESSQNRVVDLLEPTLLLIRKYELENNKHSALIFEILNWLPDLMAYLMTGPLNKKEPDDDMKLFESALTDRMTRIIENLLRLGITKNAPCYNPEMLGEKLEGVLELSKSIEQAKKYRGKQS